MWASLKALRGLARLKINWKNSKMTNNKQTPKYRLFSRKSQINKMTILRVKKELRLAAVSA